MFTYPNIHVLRINLKPLLPESALQVSPQKVLKSVQREVMKKIQGKILQSTFSHRAKMALRDGFEIRLGRNSITVVAKHPAFRPLLEGRRHRQMRWLTKATRPIPIITDTGELIFRWATPRSMENGSWYHPERKPTTILERARDEARGIIKERLQKELRKQIQSATGRRR